MRLLFFLFQLIYTNRTTQHVMTPHPKHELNAAHLTLRHGLIIARPTKAGAPQTQRTKSTRQITTSGVMPLSSTSDGKLFTHIAVGRKMSGGRTNIATMTARLAVPDVAGLHLNSALAFVA
jgi:hypothetical protein